MNRSSTPQHQDRLADWSLYVQIAGLGLVTAFAATPLAHLWLARLELSGTWQAILVGPYVLLMVMGLFWQAIQRPQRRYKALVAVAGLGVGAAAGIFMIGALQGDAFIMLSLSLGVLVAMAASHLYSMLRC